MSALEINLGIIKTGITKFIVMPDGSKPRGDEPRKQKIDIYITFSRHRENSFTFTLALNVGQLNEDKALHFASIAMDTEFLVNNLPELSYESEGNINYKRELVSVVFDIAFNQIRGAWAAMAAGSTVEWITLPLIIADNVFHSHTGDFTVGSKSASPLPLIGPDH